MLPLNEKTWRQKMYILSQLHRKKKIQCIVIQITHYEFTILDLALSQKPSNFSAIIWLYSVKANIYFDLSVVQPHSKSQCRPLFNLSYDFLSFQTNRRSIQTARSLFAIWVCSNWSDGNCICFVQEMRRIN